MKTTRRGFTKTVVTLGAGLGAHWPNMQGADAQSSLPAEPKPYNSASGFPPGSYTPHGYLDNPHHAWAPHPSGVIRSVPAVGFEFYYPAGPRGYFSYQKNSVYRASLRLGFGVGDMVLFDADDFRTRAVELSSSHHSKNALVFNFRCRILR